MKHKIFFLKQLFTKIIAAGQAKRRDFKSYRGTIVGKGK